MTTSLDTQSAEAQARTQEADGGASLEKVRDLLFGVQMRDYERKFARLEERLSKETSDLREDVKKRLAAIEQLLRTEIEALSDRAKGEHDQVTRGLRDVRQQLHEQGQQLSDEIKQKADDILARLLRESQELRTDKTDRATLAALLNDMAMRLTDDLRLAAPADAGRG
jgi:hypothetical protein